MKALLDSIIAARSVSTPLVAVTTPDQQAAVHAIFEALKGTGDSAPVISWDRARGYKALNESGREAIMTAIHAVDPEMTANMVPAATAAPASAMRIAAHLPKHAVLIALSMDRFLRLPEAGDTIQAVLNLRDDFKSTHRTLIMLAPDFDWPPELRHDVIVLEDPLPDDAGYASILERLYKNAELTQPDDALVGKATLAVRGLSAFESEQVLSMSLVLSEKQDTIDLMQAWDLKKRALAKIRGLNMTLDGPPLADLRGMDAILEMLNDLWNGPEPPLVVVRVDEFEKSLAGIGTQGPGDNTGVSQDLHQQFLTTMEDNEWIGGILVGVRGSGKTVLTQSIGAAYGVPTIAMDTGAMKTSRLGESEAAFRAAFRSIKSIGGRRVCVLATANKLDVLSPELLRRFKLGIWYFDLLTVQEREALWPIYLKRYHQDVKSPRPDDDGWTGAEIRNACELAYKLRKPVREVGAKYIIPVTKSNMRSIEEMRSSADGRFFSASRPGPYRNLPAEAQASPVRYLKKTRES